MNKAVHSPEILTEIHKKETGRREPDGATKIIFFAVTIIWALWQLWCISPLPYSLGFGVFNSTAVRSLHLMFGIFLAFLGFPMFHGSPRSYVPLYDWILALVAAFCASYLYLFQAELNMRPGIPNMQDIVVACVGMLLLLEATRRVMGWPMTIVATFFLVYVFIGPWMPDLLAHKGLSLSRAASNFWLTTDGVFGVPLGVSADFVFMYVLFGAMLKQGGAGNYLTTLSFALLGHLRGGPAKAAVLASGLHGLISGSSIANVLTCGPVTIMLMKKVGFSPEKAGAIEVAAGSNGQLMPPVMGAAAFLMVEYINMPYSELIRHAFLPAILAYSSLLYIVHLEALKLNMRGLPRTTTASRRLLGWGLTISAVIILIGILNGLMSWLPMLFGDNSTTAALLLLFAAYLGLVYLGARYPELSESSAESLTVLPPVRATLFSGLHYMLPLGVLVWCLMIKEQSPGLAAFYACCVMMVILITQRPLVAFLQKRSLKSAASLGFFQLLGSLEDGSRNMVGIALATAAAGVVVGAVSVTGIGQALADIVEIISMNSLLIVLLATAVFSIILGMGLPTTANYIIVSTLLAPVIVKLAAAHGHEVSLVTVHLFVFYFGIMADATPPVALAAFAAAGIAGGDPLKTGVQGFIYEMRTAILPFVFFFNQELLLINIVSYGHLAVIIVAAVVACMTFASAVQRYFILPNRWEETLMLVIATFLLFRPGYLCDTFYPPHTMAPAAQSMEKLADLSVGQNMRLVTEVDNGRTKIQRVFLLPVMSEGTDGTQRLADIGLEVELKDERLIVTDIGFDSRAEKAGFKDVNDYAILGIEVPSAQPDKGWFTLPGFLLAGLVVLLQLRRRKKLQGPQGESSLATA